MLLCYFFSLVDVDVICHFVMDKSVQQSKHIQRLSRQTRHHRLHLNHRYDQEYHEQIDHLTEEFYQKSAQFQKQRRLEEHRRDLLHVTVKNIAETKLPPINPSRTSSSVSSHSSCQLFSKDCALYPCQPLSHYKSFMKPENDRRLDEPETNDPSIKLQDLISTVREKKHEQHRRQIAVTVQNQHHLTNRHVFMQRTMEKLDEQSRLLHEQFTHRRALLNLSQRRDPFQQRLKHHLQISAKFCAVK